HDRGPGVGPEPGRVGLDRGEPLTADSFRPISDTKIEVVAPNTRGRALPVVVKTSQSFFKCRFRNYHQGGCDDSPRRHPTAGDGAEAAGGRRRRDASRQEVAGPSKALPRAEPT